MVCCADNVVRHGPFFFLPFFLKGTYVLYNPSSNVVEAGIMMRGPNTEEVGQRQARKSPEGAVFGLASATHATVYVKLMRYEKLRPAMDG
jgi:hypothetical protein